MLQKFLKIKEAYDLLIDDIEQNSIENIKKK